MAPKPLYKATCFRDLAIYYNKIPGDIKKRKWEMIVNSLNKLLQHAEEQFKYGDEEMAYISYMKFFFVLNELKNTSDYALNKNKITERLGGNETCKRALDAAENIKRSLEKRFSEINNKSDDHLPEVNFIESIPIKTEDAPSNSIFITSEELFHSINNISKGMLLIDCRSKDEFAYSNINYTFCLNISYDQIKKGLSASKLQGSLQDKERILWASRSVKDEVVIMDKCHNGLDSPASTLLDIMENWDPDTNYKSRIKILKNGYEGFMILYPSKCIRPYVPKYFGKDYEVDSIDDIEYPTIYDITMKDDISNGKPFIDRTSKKTALSKYEARSMSEIITEQSNLHQDTIENEKNLIDAEEKINKIGEIDEKKKEEYQQLYNNILEYKQYKKDNEYRNEILMEELENSKNNTTENEHPAQLINRANKHMFMVEDQAQNYKSTSLPVIDRSVKPDMDKIIRDEDQDSGLTGLKNLGNTCYMNSVLQCLSNTTSLKEYLLFSEYTKHINRDSRTKGSICIELSNLFQMLWNKKNKYVSCEMLKDVFGKYQPMFRNKDQQDAHELLTIFMDTLHSDLNTIKKSKMEKLSLAEKYWNEFTHSRESRILQLFYGQIKSTVKCTSFDCGKESATYESYSNLSLELPHSSNVCTLTDCLNMYFSGEKISGWKCPRCNQNREAIKKLDISRLPEVLIIHLKRFQASSYTNGNMFSKKDNFVQFPLISLDLNPFLSKAEMSRSTSKIYKLYAVSNHYGTTESGHYTAFCEHSKTKLWHKYDDMAVTEIDRRNVVSSAAYILFYARSEHM